jgi:hypothetical protein
MNNRTLKTGRALVALALAVTASIAAMPSSNAAGLPSVRLISPSYDATNSVDATGDIAQYYSAGTKAFYAYIGHGTKLRMVYAVTTDGSTPAVNQEVRLQINAPWSGSKANWTTADGTAVGPQYDGNFAHELVGTTDSSGKVTFVITNADTTGLEDAPTSATQDRGAIKPARLYGTMKPVIPGKGDKEADTDLVTFDITSEPATTFGAAVQKVAPVAPSIRKGKSLLLPSTSYAGLSVKWASATRANCAVIGKTLIAVRKGVCQVEAVNAGDDKNLALSTTVSVTIN